jgi:hypothetical protein
MRYSVRELLVFALMWFGFGALTFYIVAIVVFHCWR